MPANRILILGGTREARELANLLVGFEYDVTTSMAGVTEHPQLPQGKIRRGGFGGVEGLTAFLQAERFDHVVDVTHPFASQISRHAVDACTASETPLLRLEREAWQPEAGDHWGIVNDFAGARDLLPLDAKVMLTLGRKEAAVFFARSDLAGVARMIEPPPGDVPSTFTLILQRPPFSIDDELALMNAHDVQFLLCKNSGGPRAEKLDAARLLQLPVIMVDPPQKPDARTVHRPEAAVTLLLGSTAHTG
jgi:precorrin-6A/cobalt-precorrin-6A reductase